MATMTHANPISDLTFDWLAVLHSKAEGLHAYEKYIQDTERESATECVEMFHRLYEQDARQVEEIRDHVMKMMTHRGHN